MKDQKARGNTTIPYRWYVVLVFIVAFCAACTVQMVPSYDDQIYRATISIAKQVDKFYIGILDTSPEKRSYETFADDYAAIEAEINSLLLQQQVRLRNDDMTSATRKALEMWTENKAYFKGKRDYYVVDDKVKLHKSRFSDVFEAIARGEKYLESPGGNT